MERQGTAVKWILIMGIGSFLFLGGTAAVMRRAGMGSAPPTARQDVSPYAGTRATEISRRLRRAANGLLLTKVFQILREEGLRPRLRGTLDQPEAVWTVTEGRVDAPLLLVAVSISGGNGPAAAAWLAELARVVPPRGLRHRVAMVWINSSDDAVTFSGLLDRLPEAAGWKGRVACRMILSFREGSAVWIARDRQTPETVWETITDASRRAGYKELLRTQPVDIPRSDVRRSDAVLEARIAIGIPGGPERLTAPDAFKISGDVFYHLLVTWGYEMIVRLGCL